MGQLDSVHWVPPLHAGLNGQIADHYIYLSTPSVTPFVVTIKDGSGAILATPTISNAAPFVYSVGTGQTSGSPLFVGRGALNTVLSNRGLSLNAAEPFYVSLRVRSNNQADWAVSKGKAGLGKEFRFGGFPQFNAGPPANVGSPSNRNFVMGLMATENNTTITVSNYNPGVTLDGVPIFLAPPSFTITLNQGQTYVIAGGTNFSPNQNGFIGALIQSDKPIAMNNGNMNGTIHPTNSSNQDMGIDLSIPTERLGKEYIFIEGNGNADMERPIIIAHYDSTEIFVNGSLTPISTINAGQFFLAPNSSYQGVNHRNMFVRTSQPAYAYQALAASASANNDGGLVLVPPFSCFLPDSIDLVPLVDSIGNTPYSTAMLVTTELGATAFLNGVPLTNPEPVLGTNWQTYKTNAINGNVKITSTGGVTASVLGVASPAGYAGYFSGFSSIPLISDFTFSDTCFSSLTSFNAIFDSVFSPDSIMWNFGDPSSGANNFAIGFNPTHVFTTPGVYSVQMVVVRCKNDTITKNITIIPSSSDSLNFTLCQGDSVVIAGNTYSSTGIYIDTLANIHGCDSIIKTNLTVSQAPMFNQTYTECIGFTVTVGTNIYDSTGIYTDTLTTSLGCDSIITTNLTITPPSTTIQQFVECQGFSIAVGSNIYSKTGIFTDVINGCDTIITDLTINPLPSVNLSKTDDNCGNETGSIIAIVSSGAAPYSYLWSNFSTDSAIYNLMEGFYSVTITDGNGCMANGFITLYDDVDSCEQEIFVPNVFSPNGDYINDVFSVEISGYELESLMIYNRWGQLLFETSLPKEVWDGRTSSGENVPEGSYFYILNYSDNNQTFTKKGTITLLR